MPHFSGKFSTTTPLVRMWPKSIAECNNLSSLPRSLYKYTHFSVMPEEIAMGKTITEDEVRGLFSLWNNALATLDPKQVAKRYAKNGVLLPTVSDTVS